MIEKRFAASERARKNASALNSRRRTKREIGLRPSRVSQVQRRWWEKGSDDTKIIDFIYLAVRGCSFFRADLNFHESLEPIIQRVLAGTTHIVECVR
jgi:hypothetical protein